MRLPKHLASMTICGEAFSVESKPGPANGAGEADCEKRQIVLGEGPDLMATLIHEIMEMVLDSYYLQWAKPNDTTYILMTHHDLTMVCHSLYQVLRDNGLLKEYAGAR